MCLASILIALILIAPIPMCSYSNKVYLCTAEGDFKQQNCIRQKLFRNRKYAKYKIHLANEK